MIFYFSGTGNSLYVAQNIAKKQGVRLVNIADRMRTKNLIFVPKDGEVVGFVFPIYAWAPPKIVLDFIKKIQLARKNNYIFVVCTCGADTGDAVELLRSVMMKNRIPLNADFSIQMPDNFIFFTSVGNCSEQKVLFEKADEKLEHINEIVSKRRSVLESEKGNFAILKTRVVSTLFNRFFHKSKWFFTTRACRSCGFCAKNCPTRNIKIVNGKPKWGDNCLNCLACLHRCPYSAIECGRSTLNKDRYYNPNCDRTYD